MAQELTAPRGGSLDILAADGDTYYSIEVQLGEVDASHSFRVFDYWARNRLRFEGKTHVADLVGQRRSLGLSRRVHAWTQANLGEVRVDYSPKSYVGIRRGRRVRAPLWFRRDGASIYLPDPDGLRGEQQSPAMDVFQERLRQQGIEVRDPRPGRHPMVRASAEGHRRGRNEAECS